MERQEESLLQEDGFNYEKELPENRSVTGVGCNGPANHYIRLMIPEAIEEHAEYRLKWKIEERFKNRVLEQLKNHRSIPKMSLELSSRL